MNVLYCNFQGETETGELICNRKIADDLVEIFYELYRNEYRIGKIRLIDDYNGGRHRIHGGQQYLLL